MLAENQPSYQLELLREKVADLEITLAGLVKIEVLSADDLANVRKLIRARRSFEWVPIRLRLNEEQIASFSVHRHEFPGVEIRSRSARSYPYGALAVHALGYVGAINADDLARIDRSDYVGTNLIGKLGVEQARETQLHGVNGYDEKLVNAQGRWVQKQGGLESTLRKQEQKAGSDLILSLDLAAQQAAEQAFGDRRGAAIAIDPHNGDVLVLASMPGFDPGMFGRGITDKEYSALSQDPGPAPDESRSGRDLPGRLHSQARAGHGRPCLWRGHTGRNPLLSREFLPQRSQRTLARGQGRCARYRGPAHGNCRVLRRVLLLAVA